MPPKYYSVRVGKEPGIYLSWKECQEQTRGVSGAIFKSFLTETEAQMFLNKTKDTEEEEAKNVPAVYFDGGCRKEVAGGACYVESEQTVYYQRVEGHGTNNRGELIGLLLALQQTAKYPKIIVWGDSLYAMNTAQRIWKAKNNHDLVTQVQQLILGRDIIWKHVRGHTGVLGNEICDTYATKAIESTDCELHFSKLSS